LITRANNGTFEAIGNAGATRQATAADRIAKERKTRSEEEKRGKIDNADYFAMLG